MEQITRVSQKVLAERARNAAQLQPPPPDNAPPPYTSSESDNESDESDDDEPAPLKLTINAANFIRGSNNLVPTSASPIVDATRFSTILLHFVNQINAKSPRSVKVDLTINCGITVIGDRNVIGSVGLRPKPSTTAGPDAVLEAHAIAGAKRKAEEESHDAPEAKKAAAEDVASAGRFPCLGLRKRDL